MKSRNGFALIIAILGILSFVVLGSVSVDTEDTEDTEVNKDCSKELEKRAKYFSEECIGFLEDYLKNK